MKLNNGFKRDDTYFRDMQESQANISHLLSNLDMHAGTFEGRDVTFMHANMNEMMGKFHENQTEIRGDLADIIESFAKGSLTSQELQYILMHEQERGVLSLTIVEDIKKKMHDILSFVQHVISDTDKGKQLSKGEFQELYSQLDGVVSKVNTMENVTRSPTKQVKNLKQSILEEGRGLMHPIIDYVPNQIHHGERPSNAKYDLSKLKQDKERNQGRESIARSKSPEQNRPVSRTTSKQIVRIQSRVVQEVEEKENEKEDFDSMELTGQKLAVKNPPKKGASRPSMNVKGTLVKSSSRDVANDLAIHEGGDEIDTDDNDSVVDTSPNKVFMHKPSVHKQTQTDDIYENNSPAKILPLTSTGISQSSVMQHNTHNGSVTSQKIAQQGLHHISITSHSANVTNSIGSKHNEEITPTQSLQQGNTQSQHTQHVNVSANVVVKAKNSTTTAKNNINELTSVIEEPTRQSQQPLDINKSINNETTIKNNDNNNKNTANAKLSNAVSTSSSQSSKVEKVTNSTAKQPVISTTPVVDESALNAFHVKEKNIEKLEKDLKDKISKYERLEKEFNEKELNMENKINSIINERLKVIQKSGIWNRSNTTNRSSSVEQLFDDVNANTNSNNGKGSDILKGDLANKKTGGGKINNKSNSIENSLESSEMINRNNSSLLTALGEMATFSDFEQKVLTTISDYVEDEDLNNKFKTFKNSKRRIVDTILSFLDPTMNTIISDISNRVKYNSKVLETIINTNNNIPVESYGRMGYNRSSGNQRANIGNVASGDRRSPDAQGTHNGDVDNDDYNDDDSRASDNSHERNRRSYNNTSQQGNNRMNNRSRHNDGNSSRRNNRSQPHRSNKHSKLPNIHQSKMREGTNNKSTDNDSERFSESAETGEWFGELSHKSSAGMNRGSKYVWPPAPSNLGHKMPNTILIFPLHTVSQSTSTDDLIPSEKQPTTQSIDNNSRVNTAINQFQGNKSMCSSSSVGKNELEEIKYILGTSMNPMLFLYETFYEYLTITSRNALLALAGKENCDRNFNGALNDDCTEKTLSQNGFMHLFNVLTNEMNQLERTAFHAQHTLDGLNETLNDLIILCESGVVLDNNFFASLGDLTRNLGEIEVSQAWTDMLLNEYRAIYNRINILGIKTATNSRSFIDSNNAFLSCQGRNVDLLNKLKSMRSRYTHFLSKSPHVEIHKNNYDNNSRANNNNNSSRISRSEYERVLKDNNDLKDALYTTLQNIEELKQDVIDAKEATDHTPGAIMFYSILHDPPTYEVMKTLTSSLLEIRNVVEGKEKIDFISLKKKLEPCCYGVPYIQRLLLRYNNIHKKWCKLRQDHYLKRNENGGDADEAFVCPICMVDHRHVDELNVSSNNNKTQRKLLTPVKKISNSRSGNLSTIGSLSRNKGTTNRNFSEWPA